MKKSKLILLARVFMLTFHLGFAVLSWTYTGPAFSEGVAYAQGGSRALISDPDGLLRGNAKAKDAVGLINWVLMVSCAVPATLFTIHAGKRFNDQEYGAAFGSAIGAVIAGLGGYLAFSFI
ncbi:MAG: hypothetical protein KBF91_02445 [Alphaproteobacteria bacterium]|jgi:hypothetical protein|nr:hypothetical protein [Alphaproteobacteria bacterium]